jgi:hypothetical protein
MTAPDSDKDSATMRAESRAARLDLRNWQRGVASRHFAISTRGKSVRQRMREALGPTAREDETLTEFVDRTLGPRAVGR